MWTNRLAIARWEHIDITLEIVSAMNHPELHTLDPAVGEFRTPEFFSIFLVENNAHIGTCCLYNRNADNVELGIRIFVPELWSQGYGTEAVNVLCIYAFTAYKDIVNVVLKTPVDNIRASRCYEKCGFIESGQGVVGGINMIFMQKPR
jgi:RimJ/RimL family protein N-acetyltransferase